MKFTLVGLGTSVCIRCWADASFQKSKRGTKLSRSRDTRSTLMNLSKNDENFDFDFDFDMSKLMAEVDGFNVDASDLPTMECKDGL